VVTPEGAPELPAEVEAREAGGAREIVHAQPLEVARVGEVLRAQQVPGGWDESHRHKYRARSRSPGEPALRSDI
jgi:hypothetical protein